MDNRPDLIIEETQDAIKQTCDSICEMLLAKNRAYGNSAICPVRIFSKADPLEQINVRIDDKLSRLIKGQAAGEDAEKDLLGYLILKQAYLLLNKPIKKDRTNVQYPVKINPNMPNSAFVSNNKNNL